MVSPRILMTRLSAIGDCIETLPLAKAIKDAWPKAEILWVVDCGVSTLLEHQPHIDQVIRVRKGFLKRPSELWSLVSQLRSKQFDYSIDPQGLFKSAVLAWLSGAKQRIGFAAGQARERAWWFYTHRVQPKATHLVDRQLELLQGLSITSRPPSQSAEFGWREPDSVEPSVQSILGQLQIAEDRFAIINAGAGWASRRWPLERYALVAKHLWSQHGLPSLAIWGNDSEKEMAQSIYQQSPESVVMAPQTSLWELAGLMARGRIFVGSDCGPMHLAAATGTPCVALFGATRSEYSGAYGKQHRLLQKRFEAGSATHRRKASNEAMLEIQVSDVVSACDEILLNR
jgi:heptosyltransferase I